MRTLLLAFALLLALPAAAQSADADRPVATSIAEAAAMADDTPVTVRGEIVEVLRPEHYVLSDDSGRIHVEIDDDLMRPEDVRVGMRLEVYGEVDRDRDEPVEIDAKRVTVLD